MRPASLLILSAVSFSVAAEWRIRTEGVAGGTQPPPERERAGVGAKPHMHFHPLDRGLHRRSEAEVIEPAR